MNFETYLKYFDSVLATPELVPIYTDPEYYNYTKMNWVRMNRWMKRFEVTEETKSAIAQIDQPQQWLLITEPWCGDAAHSVPQIVKMAAVNPLISLEIVLRDTAPFLIDQYLTNGGKSIPKLIIRDHAGSDIAVWGPRPHKATLLFNEMKAAGNNFDILKEALQKWYNEDAGLEIQKEIIGLV